MNPRRRHRGARGGCTPAALLALVLLSTPGFAGAEAARIDLAVVKEQALAALRADRPQDAARVLGEASDPALTALLGHALARSGRQREAEQTYRRALAGTRPPWQAAAGLAISWARDPARRQRRNEWHRVLSQALRGFTEDVVARREVALQLAAFEHAVGWTERARRRLSALMVDDLTALQDLRVRALAERIERDEALTGFVAWPAPRVPAETQRRVRLWLSRLEEGDRDEALRQADVMVQAHPDWAPARFLRARTRVASGRASEAIADLEVLVRLDPGHGEGWALLGELLSTHTGSAGLERAARAFDRALVLLPTRAELWLQKAQAALQLGRAAEARAALARYQAAAPARATRNSVRSLEHQIEQQERRERARGVEAGAGDGPPPSAEARRLHEDAMAWLDVGDPAGRAKALLARALADSPGFVAAALAQHGMGDELSDKTVTAIWQQPAALRALTEGWLRAARRAPAAGAFEAAAKRALPWLERAVSLSDAEALLDRARLLHELGQSGAALRDLRMYVTRQPAPARLHEAQQLRRELGASDGDEDTLVRRALFEGRVDEARARLADACTVAGDGTRAWRRYQLHEYLGELDAAAGCLLVLRPAAAATDGGMMGAGDAGDAGDAGVDAGVNDVDPAWVLDAAVALALRAQTKAQLGLLPLLEDAVARGRERAPLALALALAAAPNPDRGRVLSLLEATPAVPEDGLTTETRHDRERAEALRRRWRGATAASGGGRVWPVVVAALLGLGALGWLAARGRRQR